MGNFFHCINFYVILCTFVMQYVCCSNDIVETLELAQKGCLLWRYALFTRTVEKMYEKFEILHLSEILTNSHCENGFHRIGKEKVLPWDSILFSALNVKQKSILKQSFNLAFNFYSLEETLLRNGEKFTVFVWELVILLIFIVRNFSLWNELRKQCNSLLCLLSI